MPYTSPIDHGIQDYYSKIQLPDSLVPALTATEGASPISEADITNKRYAQLVYVAGTISSPTTSLSSVINQSTPAIAKHIEVVGNVTYIGEANPGSATSALVWRCQRITDNTTTIDVAWADGNANFDNSASNITSLSYL